MSAGRLLRAEALLPVPWRNGQGITREIAVMPPGAGVGDFLWRVSLADVVGAAPFSRFPGVDRTIVLIDGAGFRMTLDGTQVHDLTTPCVPFAFPGEAEVAVALAGGPTRDFNLMLRRGRATGDVEVWRGPETHRLPADLRLLHVVQGRAETPDGILAAGDSWLPAAGAHAEIRLDGVALAVRVRAAG
ncbi:HutD family protein [Dyella ginsengisoli]|uniref:HutD family protein n=1 Tax=Dyella ginsengisoli TaxID=363848 RepID=A0ABW8K1C0_9GAMM